MEYKEYAEYREFMAALREQIHDKRAKRAVEREIGGHIEEQCAAYEAQGMSRSQAVAEAVRQMGSPEETGMALNQIHRPKTPVQLLILAAFLTLMGSVVQILMYQQTEGSYGQGHPAKLILFPLIGFGIMCLMMYMDYNWLGRYAYSGFVLYLVIYVIFHSGTIFGGNYWFYRSYQYVLSLLFPVIYAGVLYRNRGRKLRGLICCAGLLLFAVILECLFSNSFSGILESGMISWVLLGIALWKDLFCLGRKRGMNIFALVSGVGLAGAAGVFLITAYSHLQGYDGEYGYQWRRLVALLHPEMYSHSEGYQNLLQRNVVREFSLFGNHTFSGEYYTELSFDYALSGIFTWFGIAVGIIVLAALVFFVLWALWSSFRQSNRLGMLLGCACGLSMFFRLAGYTAMNFGYGIYFTTAVPFFSYGLFSTLFNSLLIGILLCVCRNGNVLGEEPGRSKGYHLAIRLEKVKE